MKISIPAPKGPIAKIFDDDSRFIVIPSGVRVGKTEQALRWLLRQAITCKEDTWDNWYVAPTYKDAKAIAWLRLLKLIPREIINKANNTDLAITFINGNRLQLKGADDPQALNMGISLNAAVLDEYGSMKAEVWDNVRPRLANTNGRVLFTGTPKGRNHFYELWQNADSSEQFSAYPVVKTIDSPWVPESEIELARSQMSPRMFRQEYEGTFESNDGLAYYTYTNDNLSNVQYNSNEAVYVGLDFNVDPMTAVLCHLRNGILEQFDELYLKNANTYIIADELKAKLGGAANVTIFPDSTGSARKTSSYDTDHDILRKSGFTVIANKNNPPQVLRVANVNTVIRSHSGQIRYKVNPNCKYTIRDLQRVTLLSDGRLDKTLEKSGLVHITDALGYLICGLYNDIMNIKNNSDVMFMDMSLNGYKSTYSKALEGF